MKNRMNETDRRAGRREGIKTDQTEKGKVRVKKSKVFKELVDLLDFRVASMLLLPEGRSLVLNSL